MTTAFPSFIPRLAALAGLAALAACGENTPAWLKGSASDSGSTQSVALVERDVEAPDVFQATDRGLWDGRPSLGGVWIAHPDVAEPERVLIRNQDNGKFVIGALFRKETATPGPRIQVSSDAAAAIDMLAGAPAMLNVTALRSEETTPEAAVEAPQGADTPPVAAADTAPAPTPVPATPAASDLDKPYIQIGIFSVESNATATAERLSSAGMPVRVIASQGSGRAYWRVVAGPARTATERSALLTRIKGAGFADAYAVSD